VAFLNFEMALVLNLWNVATLTKPIITIPASIYGCGDGDDAKEEGAEPCGR
jgi:hypothetical protein